MSASLAVKSIQIVLYETVFRCSLYLCHKILIFCRRVVIFYVFVSQANDVEGEKLLERGAALMNQSKNMNRVWTKEGQSNKKRKFIKPAEID